MTLSEVFTVLGLSVGTGGGMGILLRVLTRSNRDTIAGAATVIGAGKPRGGLIPPSRPALEEAAASWGDAATGLVAAVFAFLLHLLGLIVPPVPVPGTPGLLGTFVASTLFVAAITLLVSRQLARYRLHSLERWYESSEKPARIEEP